MQFYRRRWQQLLRFAQERKEAFYSESLGMDFVEKHFHIFEKDSNNTLSKSETQKLCLIRVIGDFQLHNSCYASVHFCYLSFFIIPQNISS
jgi:hypothetical protein